AACHELRQTHRQGHPGGERHGGERAPRRRRRAPAARLLEGDVDARPHRPGRPRQRVPGRTRRTDPQRRAQRQRGADRVDAGHRVRRHQRTAGRDRSRARRRRVGTGRRDGRPRYHLKIRGPGCRHRGGPRGARARTPAARGRGRPAGQRRGDGPVSTPTPDPPAGLPKPATEPANTPAAAPATPARDADPEADPPLSPLRPRASSALIVLVVLAVGYTRWAAQAVILPILLAVFFALIGNPIIRALQRLFIPRALGALLVLLGGLAGTAVLANQLIEPAAEWARQVPRELREFAPRLREMTKPMQAANEAAADIARAADGDQAEPVQVVRTEVNEPLKKL